MKILVSRKKFVAFLFMILIINVQFILMSNYLYTSQYNEETALRFLSWICLVSFITELVIWCRYTNEFISPYTIFFIVLFSFCCGQSLGWALKISMGDMDMWNRTDSGINKRWLIQGMIYSIFGMSFFCVGSILGYRPRKSTIADHSEDVCEVYRQLGKVMLVIVIPAFIAKTFVDVTAVARGGYLEYYVVNGSRSSILTLIDIFSEYYQPCLLILLIGYRKSTSKRRLIIFAMLIDVIFTLYVGGRSGAVMTVLGIIIAYDYFIRPIRGKSAVVGGIIGYIFLALLNAVQAIRNYSGRTFFYVIYVWGKSFSNVIPEFIGNLGWNITSITWTMMLVPDQFPYRYGMSYLTAFISWIPSIFFGGKSHHPVAIWSDLANWLTSTLHRSSGTGYTIIAESYINFGWFGLIALAIEAAVIIRMIGSVRKDQVEENIFGATFEIIVIMVLMKSIVRSSLSAAIRSGVFVILPLYIMIYIYLKKYLATRSSVENSLNKN